MNKPHFSIILLLLLCIGCSKIEPTKLTQEKNTSKDSISIWIAESNKPETTEEQKLVLPLKAFNLAENTNNDSLKALYFSKLSYNQNFITDNLLYRKINKNAISANIRINDSIGLANAYWDLADFYKNKIIRDSAFYYYGEALDIFETTEDKYSAGQLHLKMAVIQMQIKDYISSEANTIKAIEHFKSIKDDKRLFSSYNLLGIVLNDLKEYDKSLAYYNEALFYLKKTSNSNIDEASIINNIGVTYRNNKQYPQAIENFEKVLSTNNLYTKYPTLYAKAISNLATSKLYNQDTLNIERLLIKAIETKEQLDDTGSLASSYHSYAEYKAYARDTLNAIAKAKLAEELSIAGNSNEQLLKTWQYLAVLDKQNAAEYFTKYTALNDSLQTEERKQLNKFARIRFETDEFIAENIELESEKEVLSKQKQIWIGIAIGLFLFGLSIYIIINQRAKNQKLQFDQQQQANNQEIFNLMLMQKQKVDEVKRLEQKRISEELHDGVLGKMLGARMILTGLNKRATDEAIQEKSKALGSLQEIENEIRSISHELSHSAYQKINNFTDSIETLLNNNKNRNIKTYFHFNEDENWDRLAGDIKINVYRIIQETFQNAIKHSKCTNFEITFYRNDNNFNVIMSDDGIGYNVNKGKKGIGIRNITSRIDKLSGSFHIDSSEGKGTTISLNIPVKVDNKKTSINNNT
ncbi:tetratricopeptide repeat-containing sensor histidine kinase [Maribacter ulvicola]|uniref:tetratricopeptide repeat-containing sensor histidine kinase n=1 Tax=Maribacter ulvicola TaxID=228959 RepID=UPI001180420F|nr:ATP-binding protein [Maribacter ulvicola]